MTILLISHRHAHVRFVRVYDCSIEPRVQLIYDSFDCAPRSILRVHVGLKVRGIRYLLLWPSRYPMAVQAVVWLLVSWAAQTPIHML